jgi:hypothetical protein
MSQLAAWTHTMPKPRAVLIVSAHWEAAPLMLSSPAAGTPLVYDFGGFQQRYYTLTYRTPDASAFAREVAALMPDSAPAHQHPSRGLDHGAWVPLLAMYPDADIPVLQMSMPDLDPQHLFEVGRRLAPLRDEGVLIVGSGFAVVGRVRPMGRRGARARRHRQPVRVPREGARDAVRAPDRRALRPAVRDPRRRRQARRLAQDGHRRLLHRPLEALDRGALTAHRTRTARCAVGHACGRPPRIRART